MMSATSSLAHGKSTTAKLLDLIAETMSVCAQAHDAAARYEEPASDVQPNPRRHGTETLGATPRRLEHDVRRLYADLAPGGGSSTSTALSLKPLDPGHEVLGGHAIGREGVHLVVGVGVAERHAADQVWSGGNA